MDAGLGTVEYIYKTMMVDEEWSVREERGFTWWSGPLSQRVWAEDVKSDDAGVFKVHIETALLRNVTVTKNVVRAISDFNVNTSMHAFVLNEALSTLRLYTTGYVHDENLGWMRKTLCNSAGMHISDTYSCLSQLALNEKETESIWGKITPDFSSHPTSGARTDIDDISNTTPMLVIPLGAGPSPYQESDLAQLMRSDFIKAHLIDPNVKETYFTASIPVKADTLLRTDLVGTNAKLQIWSDLRHPVLGAGLLVILTMPYGFDSIDESARWALHLNWGETVEWGGAPLFGGWCDSSYLPGYPAFVCFVPALMHNNVLLENVAMWMILRSKWAYRWLSEPPSPPPMVFK